MMGGVEGKMRRGADRGGGEGEHREWRDDS